jgi:hypothetical protein
MPTTAGFSSFQTQGLNADRAHHYYIPPAREVHHPKDEKKTPTTMPASATNSQSNRRTYIIVRMSKGRESEQLHVQQHHLSRLVDEG